MALERRKLLVVVTEAEIEDEIVRTLEEAGAHGYTVSEVRGKGERGLRSAGWRRDANIRVEVLCGEAAAEHFIEVLQERFLANYAMVLWTCEAMVLRPHKF
ncbi:MAG: transcriptional regulator [Planctomycetota bacterium]|nr:MAG: transcriptional regulator [Planctomycetota bacterium]